MPVVDVVVVVGVAVVVRVFRVHRFVIFIRTSEEAKKKASEQPSHIKRILVVAASIHTYKHTCMHAYIHAYIHKQTDRQTYSHS